MRARSASSWASVRPTSDRPVRRHLCLLVLLLACTRSAPVLTHPLDFSYVDIRLGRDRGEADVTIHAQNVAQALALRSEADVLAPAFVARHRDAVLALVLQRLTIEADGVPVTLPAVAVDVIADQQAVRVRLEFPWTAGTSVIRVHARLFPAEPRHQTFLNIYEDNTLRIQDTFSGSRFDGNYRLDLTQRQSQVFARYVASGIQHIAIGPDHILFLVGLLLAGGGVWPLVRIVTAFTIAHSVTLSLAVLDVVTPPARLIEPAIALSIIVAGAGSLMHRSSGRDHRVWIAFAFGLVHGFGFASVLAETGLPSRALGLALFGFNTGVEIGQLVIVAALLALFVWVVRTWPAMRQPGATMASVLVICAGVYWFVARLFFA